MSKKSKSQFESFLIKMVAVEALQDPFFHMFSSGSDEDNFKLLDVSKKNQVGDYCFSDAA